MFLLACRPAPPPHALQRNPDSYPTLEPQRLHLEAPNTTKEEAVTQQTDINVERLASLTAYREYIVGLFTPEEAEENELCLVLVAFEMTMRRRVENRLPTPEWLEIMKWAVSQSNRLLDAIYETQDERILDWNPLTEAPTNAQQNLAGVLMTLCHELHHDIQAADDYLRHELKMAAHEYAEEIFARYDAETMEREFEQRTN
jgi:hypothetical protein